MLKEISKAITSFPLGGAWSGVNGFLFGLLIVLLIYTVSPWAILALPVA